MRQLEFTSDQMHTLDTYNLSPKIPKNFSIEFPDKENNFFYLKIMKT